MSLPDNTQRSLGRMEGKMDALLVSVSQIGTTLHDHDARLRKLEEAKASGDGSSKTRSAFMAGLGAVFGSLAAPISKHLGLT